MYVLVVIGIVVTMVLALFRAAQGPTIFDRILALNMVGTKTVLLISVFSFLIDRRDFLDLALVYSLMSFISIVAVLRFSKYGHFGDSEPASDPKAGGTMD